MVTFLSPLYLQPKHPWFGLKSISFQLKPICFFPMAKAILISKHHNRSFHALGLFSLFLLMRRVCAINFMVGGSKGWTVPTDPNALSYNQWAETHRFQIGDSLLFVYPAEKDSVLQVATEDYENCNTASPATSFKDGNTLLKFNQSGPYYFISGITENCLKNEKMVVVVMAERSNLSSQSNETNSSPPPSGSTEIIPSPAPVGEESPSPSPPSGIIEIIPSPTPVEEESPSPPPSPSSSIEDSPSSPPPSPSGSIQIIPSPASIGGESPSSPPTSPPSGASSILTSISGSIGAFVGSCLLLVL